MILRSVMRHVRDQNWIAVGLDFLIVVVGVFIGIQVANWNEVRQARVEETAILERLSEETIALIEIQRRQLERSERRAQVLVDANSVLFGGVPARPLTSTECIWIANSHVLDTPQDGLPVLDELLQTARFDLISSTEIRARLREYILLRERVRGHFRQISTMFLRPSVRHPELIQLERVAKEDPSAPAWDSLAGEGYRWQPVCDIDAMRQSTLFLNAHIDNLSRLNGHIGASKDLIDSVIAIDEALRSHFEKLPGERAQP